MSMGWWDVVNHGCNALAPAVFVGVVTAWWAKLIWPQAFGHLRWLTLAGITVLGSTGTLAGVMWWQQHDGDMLLYGLMVLADASVLAWLARE